MLTIILGLSTLTFMCFWLGALWMHALERREIRLRGHKRHAQLANAIIRVRHAFVSDVYKADTLPREILLKEVIQSASILARCEMIVETLTSAPNAATVIASEMDQIQELVARCGTLKDPFFRDTCLFYLAGLLECGKRSDEAQLLRNAIKHGTLRAKALQSVTLVLASPLPDTLRLHLSTSPAQPVSPSRAATTRKREASALDWPLVTGFIRYCSRIRSKTVM